MPTFIDYWTTLADDLGEQQTFTSTALSVDGVTVTSSALIGSSVGSDRYAHYHLYALDGALVGQQRLVTRGGFAPTTGALTLSRAFGSNPASGVNWALIDKRFGVIRQDKKPGMRDFINRALRELAVEDTITITAVADQLRYSLPTSTNWWIHEPGRMLRVVSIPANANEQERTLDVIDAFINDGETPILQLTRAFAAGETFGLKVKRPANSRLKISGTWTDQSSPRAGLTLDAEEALAPITDVVTVALAHAYNALENGVTLAGNQEVWDRKVKEQENRAAILKFAQAKPVEPYHLQLTGGYDMGALR